MGTTARLEVVVLSSAPVSAPPSPPGWGFRGRVQAPSERDNEIQPFWHLWNVRGIFILTLQPRVSSYSWDC